MPHDPPDGYVTSADACAQLGISDRTLRRRVQTGIIEGEYIPRPQGSILYVKLPPNAASETAMNTAPDGSAVSGLRAPEMSHTAPLQAAQAPEPLQDAPAATTRALEILAAALESERTERQRLSVELLEQTAARAAAEARTTMLQAQLDQARADLERERGRRWWRFWE